MHTLSHTRGGRREGAGRPKKKPSELQKTHSIRATKKDWKTIQAAARLIKAHHGDGRKARLMYIYEDEAEAISQFLLDDLMERHEKAMHGDEAGEEETESGRIVIERRVPETLPEEDAVSMFLEYYRLNPEEASARVKYGLEHEQRIRAIRKEREEQKQAIRQIDRTLKPTLQAADELNERIAKMLGAYRAHKKDSSE